jgi:hypothetical protein
LTEEPTGAEYTFQLRWVGAEELPILLINQFIGQVGQHNELVITLGQVSMPALLGSPEQQAEQARQIPQASVRALGRFALTREGLDELIRVLDLTRINYDKAQQMNMSEEI